MLCNFCFFYSEMQERCVEFWELARKSRKTFVFCSSLSSLLSGSNSISGGLNLEPRERFAIGPNKTYIVQFDGGSRARFGVGYRLWRRKGSSSHRNPSIIMRSQLSPWRPLVNKHRVSNVHRLDKGSNKCVLLAFCDDEEQQQHEGKSPCEFVLYKTKFRSPNTRTMHDLLPNRRWRIWWLCQTPL